MSMWGGNMKFNRLIPELSVSNLKKSLDFYLILGFTIKYERLEDSLVFLELDGCQLMIQEDNNVWDVGVLSYPRGNGINISMEVSNIDLLVLKLNSINYPLFRHIKESPYRVNDKVYVDREFLVQDPDGYLLRFVQE